jgi:hypothetical protein
MTVILSGHDAHFGCHSLRFSVVLSILGGFLSIFLRNYDKIAGVVDLGQKVEVRRLSWFWLESALNAKHFGARLAFRILFSGFLAIFEPFSSFFFAEWMGKCALMLDAKNSGFKNSLLDQRAGNMCFLVFCRNYEPNLCVRLARFF